MVEPVPEEVMCSITGSAGSQMNGAMRPWARRGAISPITSSVSMQYAPPPRFLDLPHSLTTEESQNIVMMTSGQSMLTGESQMVMVRNSVDVTIPSSTVSRNMTSDTMDPMMIYTRDPILRSVQGRKPWTCG